MGLNGPPIKAADEAGALGILGGTFDPIHLGHLALAREALTVLDLEQVLLVPNADPPHKQAVVVSAAAHREAMVAAAIDGEPGLVLSRLELERPGPSYTVDTVAELAARSRQAGRPEPWFILSAEALDEFETWREGGDWPPTRPVTRRRTSTPGYWVCIVLLTRDQCVIRNADTSPLRA